MFSSKVFTNTTKDFCRCSPDDIKMFCSSQFTSKEVVSEILSDVIENIVQNKSDNTASPRPSKDALHESLISLDKSDITNTLGEPIPDEKTTQESLNC